MSRLTVVPTGTANLASVVAAFRRLGVDALVTADADAVESAGRVVVPGVGSFGAAMTEIDRSGLRETLRRRLDEARPTLCICVGMQLLASTSEESDGIAGLDHIESRVSRFPGSVRVPQLGWNEVLSRPGCRFLADGWAYFANSYRIERAPDGWSTAETDYGGSFIAGLERGDVLACQFHPELSGPFGVGVLERWLEATVSAA